MAIPLKDRIHFMEYPGVDILESKLIALVRKDPELRSYWLQAGREFLRVMDEMYQESLEKPM